MLTSCRIGWIFGLIAALSRLDSIEHMFTIVSITHAGAASRGMAGDVDVKCGHNVDMGYLR
ncbi:hypothetical protein MA4S0726RB_0242 [Mycobacteroides abscessus 4S-0726-RB]|nr:hypothetical protein MA4S0726RA_1790 [Mycobacteroides abscessus 4S-0726-RA]EIU00640.1 hypothetical protein MA4S0303_1129 [Mycobacteroides abscessus 4S-0303]EIU01642.1 hypothetical protein MA4S0726RB_0242 [Mycobacteroides abscessus 4S-0726-RB]EIV52175.1 hypothetical protein MA4S0116R_0914 [Mycobacteroides abscessus 4S-0116-R]EIV61772.1 hypothetical protein MA4S0116S_4687 [Mycobacteroides abscessus 4S-0116-S]